MTYEAEVQFKFDATFTPTYGTSSWTDDDFIPEEHYLITAPAADLNAKQYFKLFEKFMLCVGMCPTSIRSGAMSLVFNDMVTEEEQRKVCKEYELTMDEDLEKKYQEFKERDAQWAKINAHYEKNFGSEPKDWGRFQRFIQYTDEQLQVMADMYDRAKIKGEWVDSADGVA
jgi:hypothetical protein